jgi:RNA polymerase primary sigma factor
VHPADEEAIHPHPTASFHVVTGPRGPTHQPPLSPELERELVAAAGANDAAARERLVESYLPAIAGMARHYRGVTTVDRAELMQEGVVGLLRAVRRYEPQRGTPFWAYASWWVRQAMQQLVSELTGPVVLSDRAARQLAKIREARREHQQAHGGDPSPAELAIATGLSREQVESLIAAERRPRGLDEALAAEDDAGATFEDLLADPLAEDEYERAMERAQVEALPQLIDALDERERSILCAHYGLGSSSHTLREIADGFGLSVERVRQIEEQALAKLRDAAARPTPPSGRDALDTPVGRPADI